MILQRLKTMFGMVPNCEQVNDFIVSYLDGVLDDKTARQFEAHISACDDCSRYLQEYKTTVKVVNDSANLDLPPELVEMTMSFLRRSWENH